MPTFTYVGESAREYPYPPIMRVLTPGDQVEFERDEDVPDDGRFAPAADAAANPPKATKAAKATEVKE